MERTGPLRQRHIAPSLSNFLGLPYPHPHKIKKGLNFYSVYSFRHVHTRTASNLLDARLPHVSCSFTSQMKGRWISHLFWAVLRIRDVYPAPDPDFSPSRIPDPTTATKEEGEKRVVLPFFVATNFLNWKYFMFEQKETWAISKRIIALFTKTFVTELGFGIRDPGSRNPRSIVLKGTGSRIWIRNTASWYKS